MLLFKDNLLYNYSKIVFSIAFFFFVYLFKNLFGLKDIINKIHGNFIFTIFNLS